MSPISEPQPAAQPAGAKASQPVQISQPRTQQPMKFQRPQGRADPRANRRRPRDDPERDGCCRGLNCLSGVYMIPCACTLC
ncbi:hypothetical protein BFJ63_vAg3224 [Fusarium oxysporum f. sp. narcissi]|uniref:Uncharacterized protein n=4 Tax=Fusarium oxysporum TaxID=5507 RepID=A0A2H3HLB7_FUSOX|nr:hypothetical protein AU210_006947 [Fusarium oxysporum f. sp. radicis-cucumerinum]RKK22599.1 hypothetical protein BFJ65_g5193 [Fusarium oxysporum f. sp. cepae]RKK85216.1 hypothetical protein BFJ71_g14269 [Fusarium oxysporum]RYC93926.1 hypothetical protein BFJ63_vAg3224 [Fusarium oxysporum f. sp. narcissi]RKK44537.1 hypothetical protein BFJ67_g9125 [Fusarium oxysporum f. sp. cepae]